MEIVRKAWQRLTNEDINLSAAALSYTSVLSLVPMLAILLSAMSNFDYFGSVTPRVEQLIVSNISQTAGTEGVKLIEKGISRIQRGKLGSFGAFILLIIATRLMLSLDIAVHRMWQVKNKRRLHRKILVYWALLLVIPVLLFTWLYSQNLSLRFGLTLFPLSSGFIFVFFMLLIIQKYLPSFHVSTMSALVGSSTSLVLLYLLTSGFTVLTKSVYRYSKIYGSLAAIPTFLLWIYLLWLSILLGVAVTSIFSRKEILLAKVSK